MSTPSSPLLEANLDRVLDGVLRTLRSGAGGVAATGTRPQAEQPVPAPQDDTSAELLTALCGRVAEALRGMEVAPGSASDYRAIGTVSDQHGNLDVRR